MNVIEVQHLSKSFSSFNVLKDVSLTVAEGEIICIIGGSGCGKSVFLRSLEQLDPPYEGSIKICGQDITVPDANINEIRRQMGMVYQSFNLFSHLNIMDNLCLAPVKLLKMPRKEAEEKAMQLLGQVGLTDKAYAWPQNLSGGQKQRIAIARALMINPKIILMDEPTSALDPTMVGEVLATIRMLAKRGLTLIIVTHEMKFAQDISSRILFFAEKGIYEEGTPDQIFNHPQRPETIRFINKIKNFDYEITSRHFDIMNIQAKIIEFCQRYGIEKDTLLQLFAEELIMIYHKFGKLGEEIAMQLRFAYVEKDRSVAVKFTSVGQPYSPLEFADDDLDYLGIKLLMGKSESLIYEYDEGNRMNIISAKIKF